MSPISTSSALAKLSKPTTGVVLKPQQSEKKETPQERLKWIMSKQLNKQRSFTTNIVAAAPVVYCRHILDISTTARVVLINAGQANAATGDAGYQDVIECATAIAKLLQLRAEEVLIETTGVIGHRIKKVNEELIKRRWNAFC